ISTSPPVQVQYLRPPQIVQLTVFDPKTGQPMVGNKTTQPLVDLKAEVRSPLPLRPEKCRVAVNGQERPAKVTVPIQQPAPGTWIVLVKGVSLESGSAQGELKANEIHFFGSNAEGECLEAGRVNTVFQLPAEPPRVRILEPMDNVVVKDPELLVSIWIQS